MCRGWKFWAVLGVAAAIVLFTGFSLAAVLPLALMAACPLSMLLMGGMMAKGMRGDS